MVSQELPQASLVVLQREQMGLLEDCARADDIRTVETRVQGVR